MGDRPQAIINKQLLDNVDLLIGVFWTRIGTPTGESMSGTVEEIQNHIASGKPAMLYFSSTPAHPDSIDPEQYKQVKEFKEKCKSDGIIETYDSLSEFKHKLIPQLAITLNKNEYIRNKISESGYGGTMLADTMSLEKSSPQRQQSPLSDKAKKIILEASRDNNGIILRLRTLGGTTIQTNDKQLIEQDNPRVTAAWEAAVDDLERYGLIQDKTGKGEIFLVTHEGYMVADSLVQEI